MCENILFKYGTFGHAEEFDLKRNFPSLTQDQEAEGNTVVLFPYFLAVPLPVTLSISEKAAAVVYQDRQVFFTRKCLSLVSVLVTFLSLLRQNT